MKPNDTITVKFFSDPGHGWLRVDSELLEDWGLKYHISPYSYLKGKWTYLEEDSDASKFIKEAEKRGVELRVISKHSDGRSTIRNYNGYDPSYLNYSPKIGDILFYYGYQNSDENGFRDIFIKKYYKVIELMGNSVLLRSNDQEKNEQIIEISKLQNYFLNKEGRDQIAKKRWYYHLLRDFLKNMGIDKFRIVTFHVPHNKFEVIAQTNTRHKTILKGAFTALDSTLVSFTSSNLPFSPLSEEVQKVVSSPDEYVQRQLQ